MLKCWNILIKLAFLIPSLKLLSKVCFPFLGYSLLPNINCHNCQRTNGPAWKTTRSLQRQGTGGTPLRLQSPLTSGTPDLGQDLTPAPSNALKPTSNLTGIPLFCSRVGSLLPAGLGRSVVFFFSHGGTIGQGTNEMTWGMRYGNVLVPSVKVQTRPSLARQPPVPTAAPLALWPHRRFLVREGGGKKKNNKTPLLSHANLARITPLRREKWGWTNLRDETHGWNRSSLKPPAKISPQTLEKAEETWGPCSLRSYRVKMLFLKREGVLSYCCFR